MEYNVCRCCLWFFSALAFFIAPSFVDFLVLGCAFTLSFCSYSSSYLSSAMVYSCRPFIFSQTCLIIFTMDYFSFLFSQICAKRLFLRFGCSQTRAHMHDNLTLFAYSSAVVSILLRWWFFFISLDVTFDICVWLCFPLILQCVS